MAARIPRKTQKVFAAGASNNGVFGSAADGTKVLSNDITTIQSKAAYNTGYLAATISSQKLPTLEELQGLFYMSTTQLAYIMQDGLVEWDAGTEYFQKSIVKKPGTFELYGSLTDNNINQALPASGASNANWRNLINLDPTINQSLATTGYKTFPGGLILQWGIQSGVPTTSTNYTLPMAFPTANLTFICSHYGAVNSVNVVGALVNASTYSLASNTASVQVGWLAIGY